MADLALSPPVAPVAPPPAPPPEKPAEPSKPGIVEKMISGLGSGVKEAVEKNKAIDATTMRMSPPELKLPPKPEFKNTDPMEAWGSIAMVFAALASSKVRNHASTAMNAAAATMKAFQEKDKEAYDRGFKEWEAASKNALDLANFQQRSYNELLQHYDNKERMNLDAGKALDAAEEAKFKTLTIALQDPGPWIAYQKNGLAGALDYVKQAQKHKEDFELRTLEMRLRAGKAGSALAMAELVKTPEWQAATTNDERLDLMVRNGIRSEEIALAIKKMDNSADIASDKETLKRDEMAQKGAQFNQSFGLKSREADDKARLGQENVDLKVAGLAAKNDQFGVTEKRKEGEDAFKSLEHADKMKLAQQKADEAKAEADAKLKFYREKLATEAESKRAALEQKAREAFDKNALGRATLEERAINDRENLKIKTYKIGETHDEFEQRMALEKDKLALTGKKDEERKAEFREKMDLQLKQFDEKKAVDEARVGLMKERMSAAEKAGSAKAHMLSPEEIEETAKEMAHLKIPMATDYLAARNPSWGAANRRAFEIAKENGATDFSAQSYPALMAQRKDAGSGQAAKGIRYLSVANKHLEAMEAAVMALPNDTDLKGLTRVFNFVSNQVNDSNLAAEQVDGQIVANEVAKAISGAGNMTGEERKELNQMFDAAKGKESILKIIHSARELLGGQAGGFVHQFAHYAKQAGISSADITGMDPEAAKSFFINPDTGETDESLVKWDRARIAATLEGKPLPPRPGAPVAPAAASEGAWKFERAGEYNGKPVGVKDGKWVYEDGSLVEGQ